MRKILCIIATCIIVLSCTAGKQEPIGQLEELTEDIRINHNDYSVADWKRAYASYKQIANDMEEYSYSIEEMKQIGELEGECIGYFMNSAFNSLDGLKNEVDGFFEGLNEAIKK